MTRLDIGYTPPAPGENIDEWSRKVTNNMFAELATIRARRELAAYLQQQQQQQERAQQEAASAMQEQKEARTSPAGGTLIRRELVVVLQGGVGKWRWKGPAGLCSARCPTAIDSAAADEEDEVLVALQCRLLPCLLPAGKVHPAKE